MGHLVSRPLRQATQVNTKLPASRPQVKNHRYKAFDLRLATWLLVVVCVLMSSAAYALDATRVKVYLLEGNYKAAISEGEKLIAKSAQNSAGLDELYYFLGLAYIKDGNYLRASDIFEIILKEFKKSSFQDEALLGLGDTYFLRGYYDQAQKHYRQLINANESSRLKSTAYYRLSQCAFKLGNTEEGAKYLRKLKSDYPMNPELAANPDLCFISEAGSLSYAVQVGAFAGKARADNLKNKLISQGYEAYIENAGSGAITSYRVKVGKFSRRQEAVELQSRLAGKGYPTKICP